MLTTTKKHLILSSVFLFFLIFIYIFAENNDIFENMRIYNFNKKRKVFFKGDIHGDFSHFFFHLKMRQPKNSLIVVLGDCGIGFNKPKYYEDLFQKVNTFLQRNNIHILMFRGNHDDPSYFIEEKIDYSNIKTIQDYSIILTQDGNILCVGGAISTDRTWRKKEEERMNKYRKKSSFTKKLYWNDESPYLNDSIIKFLQENDLKIDILATHTIPSYNASCVSTNHIDNWAIVDETLLEDIGKERLVLDNLYHLLKDNNHQIKYWYHGHFHQTYEWYCETEDCVFRGINESNDIQPHTISNNYSQDFTEENDNNIDTFEFFS